MFYQRRKRTRVAEKARSKEEKCETPWCKNRKAEKTTRYRKADGTVVEYVNFLSCCWKCHSRKLKERQPATYVLNAIRQRAKARKLPFTITLEEFKGFCERTRYLELRGRENDSMSIDRIDHDKGYHIWNIQVKTFIENCTSGHTVPGRETKQNERKPGSFDYDFSGNTQMQADPVNETVPDETEPVNGEELAVGAATGDPF